MSNVLSVPFFASPPVEISLDPGTTTFLVGANGSGKTRLATYAEDRLGLKAHRIAAHRSLAMNAAVAKISEEKAQKGLLTGFIDASPGSEINFRASQRWGSKSATNLLSDFDYVLQALFANQSNVALRTHNAAHAKTLGVPEETSFQKLIRIWDGVFPHRKLQITGDDIKCIDSDLNPYNSSEMSDGERAAFYLIGQVLVAMKDAVLIFDEPELHMHRSILGRLWDEVEAARPDCAFLVITHDLEFVGSGPINRLEAARPA